MAVAPLFILLCLGEHEKLQTAGMILGGRRLRAPGRGVRQHRCHLAFAKDAPVRLHFRQPNGLCGHINFLRDTMKPQYAIKLGRQALDIDALIASAQVASGFLKALAHEATTFDSLPVDRRGKIGLRKSRRYSVYVSRRFRSSSHGYAPTAWLRRGGKARTSFTR
jgi:hypothetical protein